MQKQASSWRTLRSDRPRRSDRSVRSLLHDYLTLNCCYAGPWFKRRWGCSANFVVRVPAPVKPPERHGDANYTVRATTYRVTSVSNAHRLVGSAYTCSVAVGKVDAGTVQGHPRVGERRAGVEAEAGTASVKGVGQCCSHCHFTEQVRRVATACHVEQLTISTGAPYVAGCCVRHWSRCN